MQLSISARDLSTYKLNSPGIKAGPCYRKLSSFHCDVNLQKSYLNSFFSFHFKWRNLMMDIFLKTAIWASFNLQKVLQSRFAIWKAKRNDPLLRKSTTHITFVLNNVSFQQLLEQIRFEKISNVFPFNGILFESETDVLCQFFLLHTENQSNKNLIFLFLILRKLAQFVNDDLLVRCNTCKI